MEGLDYTVPDGFAGSILNLQPDTEYECRFVLSDADGASGQTTQLVRVRTRAEPRAYSGGRKLHIYPARLQGRAPGARLQQHSGGLLWRRTGRLERGLGARRAQPGDTLLLHAGLYKPDRAELCGSDGGALRRLHVADAQRARPRGRSRCARAGDGEVVIDGAGNHRLFDVMASRYHIFEDLTFRNTDVAIYAGQKEVTGAVGPERAQLPL